MKSVIITAVVIVMAILLILIVGFSTVGDNGKTEKEWDVYDEYGSVDGTWGTEIIVKYEDGTSENLNEPLPTLGVVFRDKKVAYFEYILSTRGTSNEYSIIEIDMTAFEVLTTIRNQDGDWGLVSSSDIISITMDGEWYDVYTVRVEANELEILEVNQSYNLSFAPSGAITYRGTSIGSWVYVPLPNWFYLNFRVQEQDTNGGGGGNGNGNGEPEKWINVEVSSGTTT